MAIWNNISFCRWEDLVEGRCGCEKKLTQINGSKQR